ncbi:MAG: sodium-dependent bicarbonate transport family permease [Proteobacteria bacterium]|nr:sodium-dependent bicarbonate transport family permease [Pseudomonadota bacterium]
MEAIADFAHTFLSQLQKPTLAFLLGGMFIAALGNRLVIPDAVYRFIVFMLLMRIGLEGGMEIRDGNIADMLLPAFWAILLGCGIVLLGRWTLARLPGIKMEDGIATAGLFGAVSASTLAAAMVVLDEESIVFEAWIPALYPFMDIPALVLAIVLAGVHQQRQSGQHKQVRVWPIVKDSLRGSALSALLLGLMLGLFTRPEPVFESFYDPLFKGLLSVLMLIMGIEAWARLSELKRVAHWFAVYALLAPLIHGLLAFGLGVVAHHATGLSPGGVILLAVMASSNSDISGPPTLRAGIPGANPSAYIGASTSIGTPMAIAVGIPLYVALGELVFGIA